MRNRGGSKWALSALVCLLAVIFIFSSIVRAEPNNQNFGQGGVTKPEFVSDEILIKLKPEADESISITSNESGNVVTGRSSLDKLHKKYGVKNMKRVLDKAGKSKRNLSQIAEQQRRNLKRIYKLKLKKGDVPGAVSDYQNDADVEYAEPNYIYSINSTVPNDPSFSSLWGLHNTGQTGGTAGVDIDAPEAWDVNTGNTNIVVAVIDTGVDYTHEDLSANIWTNTGEIAGNGVDDDGNGYIDDVYGIDTSNSDSDPMDDHGHGTHVSGTIGAVGDNGIGIAGVNWDVSIMALKFLDANGYGDTADAIACIEYAVSMGANIMNNSWAGGSYSQSLYDAIDAADSAGVLFVAAAGNESNDNDSNPQYPAGYDNENIIAVAAIDHNGDLADFSNYGANSVDIAAPGVDIYSCLPGNSYGYKNGTSMAAPHVSGLAALMWAEDGLSSIDHINIKGQILSNANQLSSLSSMTSTEGGVNAYQSLTTSIASTGNPPTLLWSQIYDSGTRDYVKDVAIDNNNNIIVGGIKINLSGHENQDWVIRKYDSDGSLLWTRIYDHEISESHDQLWGVTVDSLGNVIAVGNHSKISDFDMVIRKYDPDGNLLWSKIHDLGGYVDKAYDVAVDSNGNIYVAGFGGPGSDPGSENFVVCKFDPDGNSLWNNIYDTGYIARAYGVAIDSGDNVIVAGYTVVTGTVNTLIRKYGSAGNLLWSQSYNEGISNSANGVVVDSNDNVIVTGSINYNTNNDLLICKYDSTGNLLWNQSYDGGSSDNGYGVKIDSSDNIVISGNFNASIDSDWLVVKYNSAGNLVWTFTYDNGADEDAYNIAVDSSNDIIVVGDVYNGANFDWEIRKYEENPCQDSDGDGYYVGVDCGTEEDCNNYDASVHPDGTEVCDGKDNNCDSHIDEGFPASYFYRDSDNDGYGDPLDNTDACSAPVGYISDNTDCDDTNQAINPETVWYQDTDGDEYSDGTTSGPQCDRPTDYYLGLELDDISGDCDDNNNTAYPGATEICNGIDDNCIDGIDENLSQACNTGLLGICADGTQTCSSGSWSICVGDTGPSSEVCDSLDNNCDGETDEGVKTTFYQDTDSDGYGNGAVTVYACSAPVGYVIDNTDCDDNDDAVNQGVAEMLNGIDDNCNGQIDDVYAWQDIVGETAVNTNPACQAFPSLGLDSHNNAHIVWGDWGNYAVLSYTKLYSDGTIAVDDTKLSSVGTSGYSSLGLDSANNVHIAWINSSERLNYTKLYSNGDIAVEDNNLSSQRSGSPALEVDSEGNVHIVGSDNSNYNGFYYRKLDNNGNELIAGTKLINYYVYASSLNIDSSDNLHLTWIANQNGEEHALYYSKLDNNGQKLVPDTLIAILNYTERNKNPGLSVDGAGNVHIVWCDRRSGYGEIYYTKLDSNGNKLVEDIKLTSKGGYNLYPSLDLDSSGNVHIDVV